MLKNNSKNNDTKHLISRREAVWRLAAFPLELYGLSTLDGMSKEHIQDTSKIPAERIIAHCAAGITACWDLSTNTDELASATNIAIQYMRVLIPIVASSSHYRKAAADVLIQCYLLRATYARLVEASNDAFTYIHKAEEYSKVSENAISRVLTLRTLASAHSYANNWELALWAAEQAKYVLERTKTPVPGIVASFVYAGLANYQAHQRKEHDALTSLGKAHATFFAQTEDEENAASVDHDESNLLLNDGMTYFHLGMPKKAHDSFLQIHALSKKSTLMSIETTFNQVMTEIYRADPGRDMEYCITHWKQGIKGTKTIQSDQRFNEAITVYTAMRAAWPGEERIKELQQQITHW